MAKLSIIIVTYNSEADIYDCVASIKRYSDLPKSELEVIVVDNNSKEADAMFAKLKEQYGEDIILIKNTHNGGYGQGNNVGIRKATAPVIMIMNPDVRLCEPIFKQALADIDAASSVGIYGMKQLIDAQTLSRGSFFCTYMMNGYLSTILSSICVRADIYMPSLMYISGSCFFLRKEMFEAIGMFDESIFMYGEEDDIRIRMMRRFGKCVKYNKRLRYIHLGGNRPPTLEYEKKLVEVAIRQNEKFGYPREKTIKNRLRNKRMLCWRGRLMRMLGKECPELKVMEELREYLKTL